MMKIIDLNNWFYSLSSEWQEILKRNIFNWTIDEESKIMNKNYTLTEAELCEIYYLETLSTVIPDPFGSEGYTPNIDYNVLKDLKFLKYLDLSNGAEFNIFPILENIKYLRCKFNNLNDLDFLQYFPSLRSLDCSCNPVHNIKDVFDLKLSEFFIDNNEEINEDLIEYKRRNPKCNFISAQSGINLSSFDSICNFIRVNRKEKFNIFQKEIYERGIEYLVHFTPTINLFSILENQELMSRAKLESLDIEQFDILDYVRFTDDFRYDNKNYINLSLSGPNKFLFSRFRQKTKDDFTINWCVLKIDPKHIYDKNSLFSVTNAASNAAKRQFGISGDIRKFKMLFEEQLNINTSKGVRPLTRKSVHPKYPTDVQAEILVRDTIPSESIMEVCFESEEKLAEAKAAMSAFDTSNFVVDKEIFSPNRSK